MQDVYKINWENWKRKENQSARVEREGRSRSARGQRQWRSNRPLENPCCRAEAARSRNHKESINQSISQCSLGAGLVTINVICITLIKYINQNVRLSKERKKRVTSLWLLDLAASALQHGFSKGLLLHHWRCLAGSRSSCWLIFLSFPVFSVNFIYVLCVRGTELSSRQ